MADSKLLFKAVFEEVAIGIGLLDISQDRYIEVNPKIEQILGYQKDEIINKGLGGFTHRMTVRLIDSLMRRCWRENVIIISCQKGIFVKMAE